MIRKHSLQTPRGQQTSVSMEDEFWRLFEEAAVRRNITKSELFDEYCHSRPPGYNLSSHIRVSLLRELIQERAA
jgi:predicted DNA-binding ribbon-helix-helix protein